MSASSTRKRSTNNKAEQVASSFSDSAKRQVGEVSNVAKDAVVSGTWAYPLLVSYIDRFSRRHVIDDSGYLLHDLSYVYLKTVYTATRANSKTHHWSNHFYQPFSGES